MTATLLHQVVANGDIVPAPARGLTLLFPVVRTDEPVVELMRIDGEGRVSGLSSPQRVCVGYAVD